LVIAEYHLIVLIIWRSLVQAQAGPQRKEALIAINQAVSAFLFVCL